MPKLKLMPAEPDSAMLDAGALAYDYPSVRMGGPSWAGRRNAARIYRAMVGAASAPTEEDLRTESWEAGWSAAIERAARIADRHAVESRAERLGTAPSADNAGLRCGLLGAEILAQDVAADIRAMAFREDPSHG